MERLSCFSIDDRHTGTGKTTKRPADLAKKGYKVMVAVPAIIHAIRASEHVREKYRINAKYVNDDDLLIETPDILYTTVTYLFNKIHYSLLKHKNPFEGYTHLILDEVHNSSEDYIGTQILINEFCNYIYGMSGIHYSLASATISDRVLKIFSNLRQVSTESLATIQHCDVPLEFVDRLTLEGNLHDMRDAISIAMEIIEKEISKWIEVGSKPNYGILIVLPGYNDQRTLFNMCCENIAEDGVFMTMIHSHMPGNPRFDPTNYNVIIGNAVASESITLPINVVIISGIQKHEITTHCQDNILTPYIIDLKQLKQSQGRVGRNGQHKGRAICLFSKENYLQMKQESPLGTETGDIIRVISSLIIHGIDMTPYLNLFGGEERLGNFMTYMYEKAAINKESQVTDFGIFARSIPLTLDLAHRIYWEYNNNNKSAAVAMLIIGIFVTGYEHLFVFPKIPDNIPNSMRDQWSKEFRNTKLMDIKSSDDGKTILNIYNKVKDLNDEELYEFAHSHLLNFKYLKQCRQKVHSLLKRLKWIDIFPDISSFQFSDSKILVHIESNIYRSVDGKTWIYISPIETPKPFAIYPLKYETVNTTRGTKVNCITAQSTVFSTIEDCIDVEIRRIMMEILGINIEADILQQLTDANDYFNELFGNKEHMTITLGSFNAIVKLTPSARKELIDKFIKNPFNDGCCPLCQDTPKGIICIISCYHNICNNCMNSYKTHNKDSSITVKCPICRNNSLILMRMKTQNTAPKQIEKPKQKIHVVSLDSLDEHLRIIQEEQIRKHEENLAKRQQLEKEQAKIKLQKERQQAKLEAKKKQFNKNKT